MQKVWRVFKPVLAVAIGAALMQTAIGIFGLLPVAILTVPPLVALLWQLDKDRDP